MHRACHGLAFVLALGALGAGCAPLPPDAELQARFRARESRFRRLAALFSEDRALVVVGPETAYRMTAPQEPTLPATERDLPAARYARYRALFRELDLPTGIRREADRFVIPAETVQRTGLDAEEKGWVVSPTPPEPLRGSLDAERLPVPLAYRRIEGDWYLYREYLE